MEGTSAGFSLGTLTEAPRSPCGRHRRSTIASELLRAPTAALSSARMTQSSRRAAPCPSMFQKSRLLLPANQVIARSAGFDLLPHVAILDHVCEACRSDSDLFSIRSLMEIRKTSVCPIFGCALGSVNTRVMTSTAARECYTSLQSIIAVRRKTGFKQATQLGR
jgi:hypothetical protein